MSRYPITNAQYQALVDDGGKEPEKFREPFGLPNPPVVGVDWDDAMAFCEWLTEKLRKAGELQETEVVRLPSEAEWEYVARGQESLIYPWVNEPQSNPELANYNETNLGETSAVGCFPRGKSRFSGCEDMAGNVWEWCLDVWNSDYKDASTDGSVRPGSGPGWVIRSGDWYYSAGVGHAVCAPALLLAGRPHHEHRLPPGEDMFNLMLFSFWKELFREKTS